MYHHNKTLLKKRSSIIMGVWMALTGIALGALIGCPANNNNNGGGGNNGGGSRDQGYQSNRQLLILYGDGSYTDSSEDIGLTTTSGAGSEIGNTKIYFVRSTTDGTITSTSDSRAGANSSTKSVSGVSSKPLRGIRFTLTLTNSLDVSNHRLTYWARGTNSSSSGGFFHTGPVVTMTDTASKEFRCIASPSVGSSWRKYNCDITSDGINKDAIKRIAIDVSAESAISNNTIVGIDEIIFEKKDD